ncbi:MAG: hypothetical protein ACI4PY_09825 [Akkermansia muciniphila]
MLRHSLRLSLLASALFLLPACGGGGGGSAAASNEEPDRGLITALLPKGFTEGVFECNWTSGGDSGTFSFSFEGDAGGSQYGSLLSLKVTGFVNNNNIYNFSKTLSSSDDRWIDPDRDSGTGGNMYIELNFSNPAPIVGKPSMLIDLLVESQEPQSTKLIRRGKVKKLEFCLKPDKAPEEKTVVCTNQNFTLETYP